MENQEYLNRIKQNFEQAKAKVQVLLNPGDVRVPKTTNDENIYIPFGGASDQITTNLGLAHLAGLNQNLPSFDIKRTTPKTYSNYPLPVVDAVIVDGEIQTCLPALKKQFDDEICGIDWVNMTMSDTTFDDEHTLKMTSQGLRHNAIVKNISAVLVQILGFGIAKQNKNGVHFYETSYSLEHNAGLVALGGQKGSVLIQINGTGCDYAKHGWRKELHAFLTLQAVNPKITRLDLAHDDLNGEYTDLAFFAREFDKGGFNNGNRQPKIEMRGNWKRPDGSGRTLYIGSPSSPRYCRIYEKGKQLGQPSSKWVRTEVEFKAKGTRIDLDALISPSNFFAMTYPCFHVFDKKYQFEQMKFERIEREKSFTFAHAFSVAQRQFGRHFYAFRSEFAKCGLTDAQLLDMFLADVSKNYPDKLDILTIDDFFKPAGDL